MCAMVKEGVIWYTGYEEGHAIVFQRRAPLAHCAVKGVEDLRRILLCGQDIRA